MKSQIHEYHLLKNLLMSKKIFLLIIFCFTLHSVFAEWIWTKKASMPSGSKRDRAVGFAHKNWGYVCTGLDSLNLVKNDLWRYDTLTNTWAQMANFPGVPRRDAVGFVIDSFGYVGTGIADSSAFGTELMDFYKYNFYTNTWDSIAPYTNGLGYGIFKGAGTAVNGKGYVFTGRQWGYPMYETWEYDPVTDYWTQKMSFPSFDGRNGASAFTIQNKAYFTCGADDNYFYNDLWEYDPALDAWTQLQNFPGTARIAAVAFVINTTAFVGLGTDGGYCNDFWSYNAATNHWSYVNLYTGEARRGSAAFSIGYYGYVATGKSVTGTKRDLYQMKWKQPADPNSVSDIFSAEKFSVYPNLVSKNSFLQLSGLPDENSVLKIFDSNGKCVSEIISDGKNKSVSVSGLKSSGEYFLQLIDVNGKIISPVQKIIVL